MILSRRAICLFMLCTVLAGGLQAQLDTIHWLPPMHARTDWGPQYLYLSTPETAEFPVSIRDGAGNLIATALISNTKPYRLDLGSTTNAPTLVVESQLHMPLQDKGLVMDGPKKFYAYYRVHDGSGFHAGDLTCKGRAALGQEFRVGHLEQAVDDGDRRGNFVGVMATEDSTDLMFSEFAPGTDFRIAGVDVPSSGPVTMHLQKGESVVFAQYINTNDAIQPVNGFMGGLIQSSKPVAVNCGSWVGAPVVFQAHDIGIDQIAPFEKTGTEYILCKGNGSGILEHPIVIAHRNGTKVWLNGKTNPSIVLNAGQYFIVPTNQYSPAGNMYIRSSEPVFVYQMIGGTAQGDDAMRTAGLMFVPPISCGVPNAVDNIYQPNRIGSMTFEGGLMLVAMKDSAVTVRIDGAQVFMGAPDAVPGNPDFVTYRNLKLFTQDKTPATISVVAQGAVQVAMYGRNEPASFAAFFSGFSKTALPTLDLSLLGDGVCPDTLIASGRFDGVQWMYGDSVLQFGPDTTFVAFAPGKYTAVGYLGVCRRTDFALDSMTASFVSPQFPYALEGPSCFGYTDGFIDFGMPYGGYPPYQYSIDNGQHFSPQAYFANLGAGDYDLVVRDSTGCYNRPLQENLEQPDSFYVRIVPLRLPDPPLPGAQVLLQGDPNRPVVASDWVPMDSSGCADCLFYTFRPEESTWVTLSVYDTAGCRAEDSLLVQVDPRVYVPNVLAPASAAGNDRFMLFSRDPLPIRRLAIYDRWGEQLFERRNLMTNQVQDGWDGQFRGEPVLPGVYLYLAELELSPGRVLLWKGDVTVVR